MQIMRSAHWRTKLGRGREGKRKEYTNSTGLKDQHFVADFDIH